jgi:GTPase
LKPAISLYIVLFMINEKTKLINQVKESLFLVGITLPNNSFEFGEQTLDELERLAITSGAEIAGREHIKLRQIKAANFIGKGHAEKLALIAEELDATGVVFDQDLSPAQNRNLEEIFDRKVLDRSTLILDIFAKHAHSKEGKLQVELAQLQYRLPKLHGMGTILSRLGGGIGTRGPGETKLETDRRHILKKIAYLKHEIKGVAQHRKIQRQQRQKKTIPSLSLIGYTNAGKSTLLNALTNANVLVQDMLFCTLDPTAKKLLLPENRESILIDTVGFIRKLPHTLIASFRATFEEIRYADLLLLVVDASSPMYDEEIKACHEVLKILKFPEKPILTILNKCDLMEEPVSLKNLLEDTHPSVAISAKEGTGLDDLLKEIARMLEKSTAQKIYRIPYHRFDLLAKIQSLADKASVEYFDEYIIVEARIETKFASDLEKDPDLIIEDN